MAKEQRTRVWLWLFVLGYIAMAINVAIKAATDSNVLLRALAIFTLVVAAFVAGTVFGFLKGQQKLSGQSAEAQGGLTGTDGSS